MFTSESGVILGDELTWLINALMSTPKRLPSGCATVTAVTEASCLQRVPHQKYRTDEFFGCGGSWYVQLLHVKWVFFCHGYVDTVCDNTSLVFTCNNFCCLQLWWANYTVLANSRVLLLLLLLLLLLWPLLVCVVCVQKKTNRCHFFSAFCWFFSLVLREWVRSLVSWLRMTRRTPIPSPAIQLYELVQYSVQSVYCTNGSWFLSNSLAMRKL